jgi:hypothetical protein
MSPLVSKWGPIIVSVLVFLVFVVVLVVISLKVLPDSGSISTLIVGLYGELRGVISYWLGSSASSKAKDDIIARSPAVDPAQQ